MLCLWKSKAGTQHPIQHFIQSGSSWVGSQGSFGSAGAEAALVEPMGAGVAMVGDTGAVGGESWHGIFTAKLHRESAAHQERASSLLPSTLLP